MTKPRSPIARVSAKRLAANGGRMFSTITGPKKPIPQVNVSATKKRRARNAKRMRGKEYQAARADAIIRSGGRCEFTSMEPRGPAVRVVPMTTEQKYESVRCDYEGRLQFHEEHYARGRILTADDGKMFCPPHHRLAESKKPHKWGKRAFA